MRRAPLVSPWVTTVARAITRAARIAGALVSTAMARTARLYLAEQ